MSLEPQDVYTSAALRGAPPAQPAPSARRCGALALGAWALAVPATLLTVATAGLGLWQLARAAGLATAQAPIGTPAPALADSPLTAAAAGLAATAAFACLSLALWLAGGWFRLMGARPLPRAKAAARLARIGRLISLAAAGLLAWFGLGLAWALAGGVAPLDVTPLAGALAALLLGSGMRLAAEAIGEAPGAN
ncbi:hypothetical protein [Albimonas pacifica]|uniref:DUF2975 domain-containing protein n=1 Tax=Albimonas pacifica TaxID=1114924 RepID=A0A1I3FAT7_9RHOB|nr:hypothetical protein [Albimonas pacifica]SFI07981.1 hypothetical protein SAMN05216258_104147 [Albimonas pacifica]